MSDSALLLRLAVRSADLLDRMPGPARKDGTSADLRTAGQPFGAVMGAIKGYRARITVQGGTMTRDLEVGAALIIAAASAVT